MGAFNIALKSIQTHNIKDKENGGKQMANEFLQDTFGGEALTFEQFNERLGNNADIKLANTADGSYVPKSEFDALSGQLADAQATAKTNAEKYADFDSQLQAAKDEGAAALNAYKLEVEVSKAFAAANVADEVSVKANLNMDNVKFGEDGKLTGLDDQLKSLKESKPHLFEEAQKKLNLGGSTAGVGDSKKISGIDGAVAEYYSK